MKNPTFNTAPYDGLGALSSETIESLRLLKAFFRLSPEHRFEVLELVERLMAEPLPKANRPLS